MGQVLGPVRDCGGPERGPSRKIADFRTEPQGRGEQQTNNSEHAIDEDRGWAIVPPPYSGPFQSMIVSISIDPKEMLSQGAKFQGLRPFAVSEDHVAFMSDAIATTETLGYLSNVIRIYNGPVQRSYETISRNFGSAASTLEGDKSRTGAALRMRGLASLSKSTELMIQGDLGKAEEKLVESEKYLSTSLTEVIRQPSTVSWYPVIKAETGMAGSMRSILQSVQASRTYAATHLEALSRFEAYVKGFEIARASSGRIRLQANVSIRKHSKKCLP